MARVCLGNIMGPKGDPGPAGPAGPKGEAGYTPVKGVDYFTEDDIRAFGNYFVQADSVDGNFKGTATGELDAYLAEVYADMDDYTQRIINASLSRADGLSGGNWFITIRRSEVNYGSIEAVQYGAQGTSPSVCRRSLYAGAWGAWAYDNPPLEPGVEYLTMEKRLNKPVYTTLINFGAMPNSTTKSVAHGLDVLVPIRCIGNCGSVTTIPQNNGSAETAVSFDTDNVYIYSSTNLSANTAYVQLWYTKS